MKKFLQLFNWPAGNGPFLPKFWIALARGKYLSRKTKTFPQSDKNSSPAWNGHVSIKIGDFYFTFLGDREILSDFIHYLDEKD